jgi:hypothetical protein
MKRGTGLISPVLVWGAGACPAVAARARESSRALACKESIAVPELQAGEGTSRWLGVVMAGMGHPLGLPQAYLCCFNAFGEFAIFLGCLLHVMSVIALGQGDLRVLVHGFFWCDDAFIIVSLPPIMTAAFGGGLVCLRCGGWL